MAHHKYKAGRRFVRQPSTLLLARSVGVDSSPFCRRIPYFRGRGGRGRHRYASSILHLRRSLLLVVSPLDPIPLLLMASSLCQANEIENFYDANTRAANRMLKI